MVSSTDDRPGGNDDDSTADTWRPPGVTALTPYVVVPDAEQAIAFYQAVFGARLVYRITGPVGPLERPMVLQAEIDFGVGRLQLADANPAFGSAPAHPFDGTLRQSIAVYVPDVDAVLALATTHGGTVVQLATEFPSGDRYGVLLDPQGLRWAVLTRATPLSDDESAARIQSWADSMSGP